MCYGKDTVLRVETLIVLLCFGICWLADCWLPLAGSLIRKWLAATGCQSGTPIADMRFCTILLAHLLAGHRRGHTLPLRATLRVPLRVPLQATLPGYAGGGAGFSPYTTPSRGRTRLAKRKEWVAPLCGARRTICGWRRGPRRPLQTGLFLPF
jgi:hypothetical protein